MLNYQTTEREEASMCISKLGKKKKKQSEEDM